MEEGKQALKDGVDPFSGRSQGKDGLPTKNRGLEKTARPNGNKRIGNRSYNIYCAGVFRAIIPRVCSLF